MKPRCQGHHDGGAHTSFICELDEGHPGFCRPYCAPDADEWRAMKARSAEYESRMVDWWEKCRATEVEYAAALEREKMGDATIARLRAEVDALRAIIESGCEQCAAHNGLDAVNRARAIDDAWGNYCRELDAEVATEMQAGRDGLRAIIESGKAAP